jgi:hypothetical protein
VKTYPDTPHIEKVIVSFKTRGKGTEEDPMRRILQVHRKDGTLIAENDPKPKSVDEDPIPF